MGERKPSDPDIVHLAKTVLEHWKLPAPIVYAVGDSAGPFRGEPTSAYAVHVAALVIDGRGAESDPEALQALKLLVGDLAYYDPLVH